MTLVAFDGMLMPDPAEIGSAMNGNFFTNATLIDAATEKSAIIFRVPKTGNLARVGFLPGTVTVADTLKVSFQDVSLTTGDPDGVVDQFRTVASGSVASNTWIRTGLITSDGTNGGVKRAVTRGDLLAMVIEFDAFVAGNLNILGVLATGTQGAYIGISYVDSFVGAPAWAKIGNTMPMMALEYDDGTFAVIHGVLPFKALTTRSFNSGSTPDEIALKFVPPMACKVGGAWLAFSPIGDTDVILYDSANTVLATVSLDKDIKIAGNFGMPTVVQFTAEVTLTAGATYRLAVRPSTVTSCALNFGDVDSTVGAAQWDQMSCGQAFTWSERTDAGAWTDTPTRRPFIGLAVTALDSGGGGGGMSRARIVNAGGV